MKKNQSLKKPIKIRGKKGDKNGSFWLLGIDEVGRGPLAGPVTVCAFGVKISDCGGGKNEGALNFDVNMADMKFRQNFSKKYPNLILNDSKKTTERRREGISLALRDVKNKDEYRFFIKSKSAKEIDKFGISVCIHKLIGELLKNFMKSLGILNDDLFIILDGGLKAPSEFKNQETHIKGDAKFAVISCASILAKVYRDDYVRKLSGKDKNMVKYGFEIHKGYGTRKHIESIRKNGVSLEHRKTFLKNITDSI